MRIVFMGSPAAACPSLEGLVRAGYEVAAVYTQPDRPAGRGRALAAPAVKLAAAKLGLPVRQPTSLRDAGELKRLAALEPEAIVVCAYGQILTRAVLDIPPRQCLNVHFSLLPRHRGAAPVAAAILAGDAFTGVTIQLVRKKLDTGPVLARAAVPVLYYDTAGTLTAKLAQVGAALLLEALSGWGRGEITPQPQDESAATYVPRFGKGAGEIDWNDAAERIVRLVRAYQPWPGAYTKWGGKRMEIIEAAAVPGEAAAGKVLSLPGGGISIGTGAGLLEVRRLQLAGNKPLTAAAFVNGHRDIVGAVLPD